ncbi:hypothetical protein FOZ62_003246, partial [Perkinsus olseni]
WQVEGKVIFLKDKLNPLTFSLYRQGLAAAVLLCFIDRSFKMPARADLPLLVYLGAATGAATVAFLVGLELSSALIASMLQPTVLVFAYIFGILRGTEHSSRKRVLGVVTCVAAAVGAVISGEHVDDAHPVDWSVLLGGLLILLQCILTSSIIVLQRGLRHLSPPYLTGCSYLIGSITTLLLLLSWRGTCVALELDCGVLTFALGYSGSSSTQGLVLLLYAVLLATCFVYCAMNWCNRQTSPSVVASFMTLQPVTTAIVQYWLLQETPAVMQVLFFPFIVAGVTMVSATANRIQERPPEDVLDKAREMQQLEDVETGRPATGKKQQHLTSGLEEPSQLSQTMAWLRVLQKRCAISPVALAYILLFANLVIGSGWEVGTKLALSKLDINLLTLAFYRQFLGCIVLLVVDRSFKLPKKEDVMPLAVLGVCTSIAILCFFKGVQLTTPLICALLHPTLLVFCYALGILQGCETYSRRRVLGVVLSVGAAMASSLLGEEFREGTGSVNWNVLLGSLIILAGVFFAAAAVVYQRESIHLPFIYVEGYAYVFASLTTFIFIIISRLGCIFSSGTCSDMTLGLGLIGDDGAFHFEGWLLLLYGVLLMSCFLYCSINWANRQTSPSVVASFATLQPVGTGTLQYLVTGKQVISLLQVGMYLFVVIGVVFVSLGHSREEEPVKSSDDEKETLASDLEDGAAVEDELEDVDRSDTRIPSLASECPQNLQGEFLGPLRFLPRTICHKPFSTVQALVASTADDTERLPIHADRPSKFPCLGDADSDGIQTASVFDKIKHRRRRGGRVAVALYTPPSQLNGVSEFAESRDISLQFTYISRAQIRDISVWHSISYQTMRQLKLLNTTDISAVARAMAFMGYRDTFLLNGLADAMWCLAKVRRGKLFDSAEILHSFRKLNFIPRMLALDAITADLRRQGWDRYKWRSADIAKIFLYYSSLPPRVADRLRDQAFLQDLEAHIETKLGRMSARDISLISRSTSISLDRLTEAFLRSKEIRTGNLLYFCITLLKADVTRPPVNFMNRLRREIDSTFTQLKPAHIERFLHVFMNFECFSDERILICLARATESNLDRMSQRRLRSIFLAFHRLCKPTNSLLPQLAARVRAAVPREAIHAETIALLMRAFAVESPLKQQQNTRLILNDLGRQLVERLNLTVRTAATRHPITSEVNTVKDHADPVFENRVSTSLEVVESTEDNTPSASAVGGQSGRNEPPPSRVVHPSPTVLRSEPSPRVADTQRIPSVRYEPVDTALGAEDDLDEDQLAVLKQMEEEVQLLRDIREQEIAGENVSVGDVPETVDLGPRGEYDDFINSDRVTRLMHVVAGKHPAHHRLIRKLGRMEKKLADLYPENDSEEPAVKSREYREVVRRWKRRKSRELTGEEKHRLAAGFERFTIRWRKWRRKILAKYCNVDFDSVARHGPGKLERRVARPKKLMYNQKSYLALRKSAALAEALKDTQGLSCRSQVYESLAHNAVEHVRAITDAETALEEFSQLVLAIVSSQEPLCEAYGALIAGFQEALNRETVHGSYLRLATAYVDLVLSARTMNGSIARSLLDRCLDDPTVRPNELLLHACPITTLSHLHGHRREELKHRLASALATPSTEALSSASTLQDSVACLLLLGEDIWPVCDRLSLKTENVQRAAAAMRTRLLKVSA